MTVADVIKENFPKNLEVSLTFKKYDGLDCLRKTLDVIALNTQFMQYIMWLLEQSNTETWAKLENSSQLKRW